MVRICYYLEDQGRARELESRLRRNLSLTNATSTAPASDLSVRIPVEFEDATSIVAASENTALPRRLLRQVGHLLSSARLNMRGRALPILASLRLRNRKTSHIEILPPELLSWIFELCHDAEDCGYPISMALTLSHVCAYWRGVAISTPALWTTVDYSTSIECGAEMLRRSGALPVDLTITPVPIRIGQDAAAQNFALKPDQFNRAQAITWHSRESFRASFHFSDNDYAYGLPHLRRLNLRGVAITPWTRFSDLTHLSLHNLHRKICPNSVEIMDLLERCPSIQEVSLKNLQVDFVPDRSQPKDLMLSDLEVMELEGSAAYAVCCQSRAVVISPDASLWEPCDSDAHEEDSLGQYAHGDYKYLIINPDSLSVQVGGSIIGHTVFEVSDRNVMSDPASSLLSGFAKMVDVAPIQAFHCYAYCREEDDHHHGPFPMPTAPVWTLLLRAMVNLEELRVTAEPYFLINLLLALWPGQNISTGNLNILERRHYYPKLKRIRLRSDIHSTAQESQLLGDFLATHLWWRSNWVRDPLQKLEINFGEDEDHEKMRRLVQELVVDSIRAPKLSDLNVSQ